MKVDRPEILARELDRVVLLFVDQPLYVLRGTRVHKYIKYGENATYASKKSKAVPVPQRSSCAGRDPWYDLTKLVAPGFALWPMAQQYRHIIPENPQGLICNHNLFDLSATGLNKREQSALVAILNSTLVGLFKTFYGRFAGTEGNLNTEVVDVNLIEVPDPRDIDENLAKRLTSALRQIEERTVGHLVEEPLKECHSYHRALQLAARPIVLADELCQSDRRELDDAVFELLGVESASERRSLLNRLYEETAAHFRAIRITEIQKMEDRRHGESKSFSAAEAVILGAVTSGDVSPIDWIRSRVESPHNQIAIPDERPVHLAEGSMFDHDVVYFGARKGRSTSSAPPTVRQNWLPASQSLASVVRWFCPPTAIPQKRCWKSWTSATRPPAHGFANWSKAGLPTPTPRTKSSTSWKDGSR